MRFFLFLSISLFFLSSDKIKRPTFNTADQLLQRIQTKSDTTYIVNFWATWCAPCVKELPNFERMDSLYGKQLVKVLLVSLDFKDNIDSKLIPFIARKQIHSEVIWLNEMRDSEWIPKMDNKWQGNIPATLFMNPGNAKRKFVADELNFMQLDSLCQTIR
jgi:thiol-disulfide isomerase/thioredoxin